jgi:hypothetical protein
MKYFNNKMKRKVIAVDDKDYKESLKELDNEFPGSTGFGERKENVGMEETDNLFSLRRFFLGWFFGFMMCLGSLAVKHGGMETFSLFLSITGLLTVSGFSVITFIKLCKVLNE